MDNIAVNKPAGIIDLRQMSNQRNERISVVIPAYNESGRITHTLGAINNFLEDRFRNFEIVVVNDGSSDDTAGMVLKAEEVIPSIKYVEFKENHGKGFAIREGVSCSKGDMILISDADLSTPIEEMDKLVISYDKGEYIVIGSRALAESDIVVRQPWWREFMGKTFNRFVRLALMKDFRDTQCGFKLFRGDVARDLFARGRVDGFAYDVEVLYLAKKGGYRIKEVPVKWINAPDSKVRPVRDSLGTAMDVLRIRFRNND